MKTGQFVLMMVCLVVLVTGCRSYPPGYGESKTTSRAKVSISPDGVLTTNEYEVEAVHYFPWGNAPPPVNPVTLPPVSGGVPPYQRMNNSGGGFSTPVGGTYDPNDTYVVPDSRGAEPAPEEEKGGWSIFNVNSVVHIAGAQPPRVRHYDQTPRNIYGKSHRCNRHCNH